MEKWLLDLPPTDPVDVAFLVGEERKFRVALDAMSVEQDREEEQCMADKLAISVAHSLSPRR